MGLSWSKLTQDSGSETNDLSHVDTVILGAGVIGLSTAYQLALALDQSSGATSNQPRPRIVVIEPAAHISPSASGQATGGLGSFGFGSVTAQLGLLSYDLLRKAALPDGPNKFEFSDLTVYRITPQNFSGATKPPDDWGPTPPIDKPLSALPDWIRPKSDWTVQLMATPPHAAHLDPAKFCKFLEEECLKLGVKFIFNARATAIESAKVGEHFSKLQVASSDKSTQTIACRSLVIAAGPWSPRVLSDLFPHSMVKLPMNSTASAGNHFRVRRPNWKPTDDETGSEQVFLQNDSSAGRGLDITSFAGGDLYVGGWGAIPEELPDLADSVKAQPTEIQAMSLLTKEYLRVDQDEKLEIFDVGRCYRPLATPNHPIITKVDWDLLGIRDRLTNAMRVQSPESNPERTDRYHSSTVGGLFLNTAHYSDGMTLSLGSGKVLSELLLGLSPSIDISGLGLQ